MSVSTHSIQPQAGEPYRQFVPRAHTALMQSIPDSDERNEAVWRAWYSVHGDPLADRAKKLFPDDRYRTVPNVCYFCEHETKGRDGMPVKYGVKELGDIVDEHNERADTDNYTAMTNGHTVDGLVPDSLKPRVVGYAGPYRLGMIGNIKPRFAVFADEHHLKEELPNLERKKRRSVEINRFKDGRRPYIDPVAVLGAESPRLALPVARYQEDGAIVERYDVSAVISGSNTFIPRAEPIKERHSTEPTNVDMNPNASDQDALIQNLVKALLATPEMQFVRSQMQAGQGGQPQPQVDPSQSQPQVNPQGGPSQGQPDDVDQNGFGAGAGMGASPVNQRYSASNDDDRELVERFSALSDQHYELTERYSQLEAVNRANMEQMGQMTKAIAQLEQRAVDADRTMVIKDLYQQYPHFVELDRELDTCLYSHGSDMNAEAFDRHVERLSSYAKRSSPTTHMLPGGSNEPESSKEQYSADFTDRVIERYTQEANRGKVLTFEDAAALVRAEGK